MRAHYLQHVPFEGPGNIERWLGRAGYTITSTHFHLSGATLPDPATIDFLVVMGGSMSVNDEVALPWLIGEKRFIAEVIAAGTPVLGVCLGAQLIASALGARIYSNPEKEIGWFPIEAASPPTPDSFRFPATIDVFHWHGETFDLPAGAVRLASSPGCANQAFQIGRAVIGLQFHLETTAATAQALVTNCRGDLTPGHYVQTEAALLSAVPAKYRAIEAVLDALLNYLHRGAGGPPRGA